MPPRKERTPELRSRLLDVAIELLADDGVQAVTTRNVARRAGTSAPAIYELFTNKSGLAREVFFEGFRRLGAMMEALGPPNGTTDGIVEFVEVFRDFCVAHPELFRVMYSHPFSDFAPSPEEMEVGDTTRSALVVRVGAAVDSGALVGDPVDISHALMALAIGLATQETGGWLASEPQACARRWQVATSALLKGLAEGSGLASSLQTD